MKCEYSRFYHITYRGAGALLTLIILFYTKIIPSLELQSVASHDSGNSPGKKAHNLNLLILFQQSHNSLCTLKCHKCSAILITVKHVVPVVMNDLIVLFYFLCELLLFIVLESFVWNEVIIESLPSG